MPRCRLMECIMECGKSAQVVADDINLELLVQIATLR